MIAFGCPKSCPLCKFCQNCAHLCGGKCSRLVSIAMEKAEAKRLAEFRSASRALRVPVTAPAKVGICAYSKCRKPYLMNTPQKLFCNTGCNRKANAI